MPIKKKKKSNLSLSKFFIIGYIALILAPLIFHFTFLSLGKLEYSLLIQDFVSIDKISTFRVIFYTAIVFGTCINFLLIYAITMIYNKIDKDPFTKFVGYGFGLLCLLFFMNFFYFLLAARNDSNIFVLLKHFFYLIRFYFGLVLFGSGVYILLGKSVNHSKKALIFSGYYILIFILLVVDIIFLKTNKLENGFTIVTIKDWYLEIGAFAISVFGVLANWVYCNKNQVYFKKALALGMVPFVLSFFFALGGSSSVMDKGFYTSYLFIFVSSLVFLIGAMYTNYQTNKNAITMIDAKQRFLANMSHELRTPINAISGATDLLIDDARQNEDTETHEMLSAIKDSSLHLFEIVSDILEYSNLEHGEPKLKYEIYKCVDLSKDVKNKFINKAKFKGLQLIISVDKNFPLEIKTDKKYLFMIISHLIENAIKFTKAGSVECNFKRVESSGKSKLQIEVRDTGIGIEKATIDNLFDEFSQADNSSTRAYEGLGLGLAICRKVIRLLRGKLNIKSEIGSGSVFLIELPIKK